MTSLITPTNNGKLDVLEIVNRRIPGDMRWYIQQFLTNECKYAEYDMKYTWEEIEDMWNDVLPWGPEFCSYLFKNFEKMGDNLQLFYPNADTDTELTLDRINWHDDPAIGVSFNKTDWFSPDYCKMPGGRKRWYLDDDGTNYENMAKMITTVLRKFDEWYWTSYNGTGVDHDMLIHINKVYAILEKYAHMDHDEFENDNNSIEHMWTPWDGIDH